MVQLEDVAEADAPGTGRAATDLDPPVDHALLWIQKTRDRVQERGLPAPRGAKDGHEVSARDVECDVTHDLETFAETNAHAVDIQAHG